MFRILKVERSGEYAWRARRLLLSSRKQFRQSGFSQRWTDGLRVYGLTYNIEKMTACQRRQ